MSFFKAYDMRGVFGRDFDCDTVYAVGRWLPVMLQADRILVGRDVRQSSDAIFAALAEGITESGGDVDDMGLATTPMVYYFTAKNGYAGSVQITASHNPAEYNGMKLSRRDALPVGYDSGLQELEARVLAGELPPPAAARGSVRRIETRREFIDDLRKEVPDLSGLRIGVDCSSGMAALVARELLGDGPLYINETMDGSFPAHAPNPLESENCAQLMALVLQERLDVGVIFDGDADRVMFIDELGAFVQPDYLIGILARRYLRREPGCGVIHDIRTSRGVIEYLQARGARTVMGRVGHAYAKVLLRESGSACGGELAGHYYLSDFQHCDSGEFAALIILGEIAAARRRGVSFSAMIRPLSVYANSGELNFRVADKAGAIGAVLKALERFGKPSARYDFDGCRMEFPTWWMNVRQSNTEPYLRLVVEAADTAELEERKRLIVSAMREFIE
jgi:phosphomannomutase